jgi:TPP-dependent trihydroxycyclohexane-1,2-dione (THcHDO) dehydratase
MVHYEKAAQGLGANGELVERAEDIAPAMKRALGSSRITCLNIVTDSDVVEPGTLAMYSAGAPKKPEQSPDKAVEEKPADSEGTTLPYYGKRKLE